MIEGLSKFLSESSSWYVKTFPNLVANIILVVEI